MLAKLETPRVENVLLRQRLFKEIDKARNKPVTWISSPAGSGKTTLVASYLTDRNVSHLWYQLDEGDADPASFFYHLSQATSTFVQSSPALPLLTPEYLSGITVFARNFFRELFGQLTQPAVVVMDNYQDVPEKSMLHELLAAALMEVPKDIAIIIISRENPPATYARLQAHGDIQMLDWEQIKLARSESDDIAELRSGNVLNAKIAEDLYFKTNGWVTGLVLLLEHAERVPQTNVPTIGNHGLLFDYFAEEIFNSTDNQTQQFLLYTALLPKFSLKMADALVGKSGSTDIIKNLCSKNYFIIAHKGDPEKYEYHPLFRGFLKTLGLTRLSEVERVVLNESAINLLHACGETDTAILLAKETENWPALIQLITLHAANLVQDGRYSTLSEWLTHLPDQSLETNTWLRYWQAVTMIFTNPLAARVMLEAAYHNFIAEKNNIGSALVWSSIIDTYLVCWSEFKSLDPWLDVIILQAERIENSLPIEIQARFSSAIFIAFLYRKPADKNMSIWAEKVWKLFLNIDNSQLRLYLGPHLLMYYMWWIGDLAKAKTLLEPLSVQQKSAEPDPFHNLLLYAIEGGLSWMTAKNQQALESADQGLSLAENSGIHTWDIFIASQAAFGALSEHDLNKGVEYLELMKQRLITSRYVDSAWYDYIQGWYQYLLGNKQQALAYLQQSRELIEHSDIFYFTGVVYNDLGRLLVELEDMEQGLNLLEQALIMGQQMQSGTLQYLAWLSKAEVYDRQENLVEALKALQKAFAIAREYQIYNHAWWRNTKMVNLYSLGLTHDVETDYIKTAIRKRKLIPQASSIELESWPWPIKIYTLGRFSLVKDDSPISFNGKAQTKPLELLKVLIALGGREVSDTALAEAIWSDSDGDMAFQNLKITIHRLRKLLQHDVLDWQDAKLTLNPHLCWVDVWSVERQVNKLLSSLPTTTQDLQSQINKILAMYHGPFLQGDEHSCILGLRERLRSKLLRLLTQAAEQLYAKGDYSMAIHYYQQGLELELLAESFYQGLMRCYLQLGNIAEGLVTYHRCQAVFKSSLNITPSAETTNLAKALQSTAL